MNNYKIAILITTFLRDNLLYKTLQTIVDNYTENYIVLIADQGYDCEEKKITIDYIKSQIPCEYYRLPFDCGAYVALNFLIKKTSEMQIPYILRIADSIQFLAKWNFGPIIQFLELEEKRGLVGFELRGSKCIWEYLMEITPKGIKFSYSDKDTFFGNIKLTQIDICRNVYLAKTKIFLDVPFDEELKLGGHELTFYNLKQKGYECYWTDSYIFKRVNSPGSIEYKIYRNRFNEYLKIAKEKMGIKSGWVIYPKKNEKK